jgi:hypothetical protein
VEEVTLEQYAGVSAALVEGFALPAVLESEGLDAAAWPRVSSRWSRRLGDGGAGGPLATVYRETFAFARRWLGRRVAPLEDDIGAWLAFLNAWSAHPAPFELLDDLGMSPSDVSRVQGAWAARIADDEDLRKKALELARNKPSAIPKVTVTRADLRPFPWTKKRTLGTAPAALEKPKMLSSSFIGDSFGLERYASLHADLSLSKQGTRAVLARQALTDESFAAIEERWRRRFATDPTLEQDFRRLVRYYEARLRMRPPSGKSAAVIAPMPAVEPPLPPQAPPAKPALADLAGTSLALDVPRGEALPFAKRVDPPSARLAATSLALDLPVKPALPFAKDAPPSLEIAAPLPAAAKADRRPAESLSGTSLALNVPRGDALPFAKSVAPPSARLAATSLALDLPVKPALPFATDAPPSLEILPAAAKAERRPGEALTGTSLALNVPRGDALPFAKSVEPRAARLGETSLALDLPVKPALPFANEPKPPALALSLEQHASLSVEVALEPARALATLARYGLTPEAKRALDEHYRAEVAKSPAVREAWERAYRTYYDWVVKAAAQQGE